MGKQHGYLKRPREPFEEKPAEVVAVEENTPDSDAPAGASGHERLHAQEHERLHD